jgi:hypothetical protein
MEITMKKIMLLICVFCFLVSTAYADKNKKVSSKIAEKADEIPCTCVFNKNRMWNPEEIVWNNQLWECAIYKDDGTCSKVQIVKEKKDERANAKNSDEVGNDNKIGKQGRFLISDSGYRSLSKDELSAFTPTELRIIRNEIFARHGYVFKSKDLQHYFSKQSWYEASSEKVSLSTVEAENVRLLKKIEANSMTSENFQSCMVLSNDVELTETYYLGNWVEMNRLESKYNLIVIERLKRDTNQTSVDRNKAEQELRKLELINIELENAKDSAAGYKRKLEKLKNNYEDRCIGKSVSSAFKYEYCSEHPVLRDPFCKSLYEK